MVLVLIEACTLFSKKSPLPQHIMILNIRRPSNRTGTKSCKPLSTYGGFPKLSVYLLRGPKNKDYSISGSIWVVVQIMVPFGVP